MKKIFLMLLVATFLAGEASAIVVSGVNVEPTVTVNDHSLQLNGYGIRKKWWVKVYIGSLYTAKPTSSLAALGSDPSDKVIRLNFLHSKVDREKITEAMLEGFANTHMDDSDVAKKFMAQFKHDFVRGDSLDLILGGDGTVVTRHNGQVLGTISSRQLVRGILGIYFGPVPADEALKRGMLGN